MQLKFRKILYFAFILFFLISAPLVVLYTAGYRYNFGSGKIVQTGVISVTTVPRGADIYIDNLRQRDRSPAVIDNVFPGKHEVRLEKRGYTAWSKTLIVQAKETTFVDQAGLYVDTAPAARLDQKVLKIYPGPAGWVFAYLIEEISWRELWIFDTGTLETRLLARLPLPDAQRNIDWSADGSYLSLQGASLSLINTKTAKNHDLAYAEPGWWDAERGDTYYFYQNKNLKAIRLPEEEILDIETNPVAAKSAGSDYILAQKIDNRVVVARNQGQTSEIYAYLPLGDYYFQPSPNSHLLLLEDKKRERIFLIDTQARDQPILLNSVAVLWQWSPDGQSLMYSDGFDLHIYFVNEHLDKTLTRLSEPITGLAWYAPANSVFFCQADKLVAVDLDRRQGYSQTVLTEGEGLANLLIDPKGWAAYFYGSVGEANGLLVKKLLK